MIGATLLDSGPDGAFVIGGRVTTVGLPLAGSSMVTTLLVAMGSDEDVCPGGAVVMSPLKLGVPGSVSTALDAGVFEN